MIALTRKATAVIAALTLAFSLLPMWRGSLAFAAEESVEVATWQELQDAIADAATSLEIILTADVVAESSLEISGDIAISGKDGITISRQSGNANFPVFQVVDGGKLTLGENLTLTGKQGGSCVSYTTSDFAAGTLDDPHGFFLEVESGGVATLAGATLTNFLTSGDDMQWAAPVVANGGEFNIMSGAITANSVGYTADNSKSTDGTTADLIGVEEPDEPDSRLIKQWARTNTAGGVIYNAGATGTFTGGSINGNRADTGAIVVQGSGSETASTVQSVLTINDNALIDNNTGVHYAGGVFIYNGGQVYMDGGTISNNFAWSKGGGVWAMSEVYGTAKFRTPGTVKYVAPAGFALGHPVRNGANITYEGTGVIKGNLSVSRGGGINVSSNNVALFSGQIIDNGTRTTGGGVYVEGDAEDHMYQLYMAKGWVTDNHAVKEWKYMWESGDAFNGAADQKEWNAYLDRGLPTDGENACEFDNTFVAGKKGSGNAGGALNVQGNGGGLWMCAFGGNATIDYTGDVEIGGNDAHPVTKQGTGETWDKEKQNNLLAAAGYTYDNYAGNDIMLSPGLPGDGSALNIIGDAQAKGTTWTDDNAKGATIESGRIYTGGLGLTNSTWSAPASTDGGVLVSGNIARLGGGLGADGSMVFGNDEDIYRIMSRFRLTKVWGTSLEETPININLEVQVKDETTGDYIEVGDLDGRLSFMLDGEADSGDAVAKEIEPWVAEIGLPLAMHYADSTGASKVVAPYTFKVGKIVLDPSVPEDLAEIYRLVNTGELTKDNVSINDWRIKVTEKTAGGSAVDYIVNLSDIVVSDLATHTQSGGSTKYSSSSDESGNLTSFDTRFIDVKLDQTLSNEEVKVEKYVNKKVHDDIVEFDKTFTYDIMAYVPAGSTEVTLDDTLIDDLMFVDAEGNAQYLYDGAGKKKQNPDFDASKVVINNADRSMLVLSKENDHKGNGSGTVAKLDSKNDGTVDPSGKVAVSDKKITLTLDEAAIADITKNGGTWVRLTFDAQVSPDRYDALAGKLTGKTVSADDLTWSNLDDPKYSESDAIDDEKVVAMYTNPAGNRNYARTMYHDVDGNEVYTWYGRWNSTDVGDYGWYKIPDGKGGGTGPAPTYSLFSYDSVSRDDSGNIAYPAVDESEWAAIESEETQSTTVESRSKLTDWFVTVERNAPVLEGADTDNGAHEGLPNSAGYTVKFGNDSEYSSKTNTVTVKPELTSIEASKKWVDVNDTELAEWPEGKTINVILQRIIDDVVETLAEKELSADGKTVLWENLMKLSNGRYEVIETGDAIGFIKVNDGKAEQTEDATGKISAVVTNKETPKEFEVVISKQELGDDTKELPGAEITITDKDGNVVDSWTSTDEPHKITVTEGEYTLEEINAPEGFEAVTTKIRFTVDKDGNVEVLNAEEVTNGAVSVKDINHLILEDAPKKDETPEIEKFVKKALHSSILTTEVFEYDIVAYVTPDADGVEIYDTLDGQLHYMSAADEVTVVDLGIENNHKVVNDIDRWRVNDDATVETSGTSIDNAVVKIEDQDLTVTIADAKALRGHWVKVTVEAQLNEGFASEDELSYETIDANQTEERATPNVGNAPVVSDETHEGIPNKATYKVSAYSGKRTYNDTSNTVTVRPRFAKDETRIAINKIVAGAADNLSGAVLQIEDNDGNIVVDSWTTDGSEKAIKLTAGTYKLVEVSAPVGYAVAEPIEFRIDEYGDIYIPPTGESAQRLEDTSITMEDKKFEETSVKFSKTAVNGTEELIGATLNVAGDNNVNETWVSTAEQHEIALYPGMYTMTETRAPEGFAVAESITFRVTEDYKVEIQQGEDWVAAENATIHMEDAEVPDTPAIEKYVNQAVHKDIALDEVFTYDIIAYITRDADSASITDTLIENLEFAADAQSVKVVDLGENNNHKVTNNIANVKVADDATVAEQGEAIDAAITVDGKTLTVDIEDATTLRKHFVKVTFTARVAQGKTIADITPAYNNIAADANTPVLSDEAHTGLPNAASYTVSVDGEVKYALGSNTVTVKPVEKPSIKKPLVKTGDVAGKFALVSIFAALAAIGVLARRRKA